MSGVLTDNRGERESTLRRPSAVSAREPASEAMLLANTARGDRAAFQRLYYLFHRRLARFLLRLTRRPDVAEEIINDTMLAVWQGAADFRGDSRVSTWIMGIAYRRALKALSRERDVEAGAELLETLQPLEAGAPEGLAHGAELADWLEAALARLSPEHRLVIELAHVLGLSCQEISEITDTPVNTVKTRMFYARQRLQTHLAALATPGATRRPAS